MLCGYCGQKREATRAKPQKKVFAQVERRLLQRLQALVEFSGGEMIDLGAVALNGKRGAGAAQQGALLDAPTLYQAADQASPVGVAGAGGINYLPCRASRDFFLAL